MTPTATLDPEAAASWVLLALDLLGVFVFALSGGLAAVRQRFGVVGVHVLAVAAGLGGGILRDVLIGAVPTRRHLRLSAHEHRRGCRRHLLLPPPPVTHHRGGDLLDALGLSLFAVAYVAVVGGAGRPARHRGMRGSHGGRAHGGTRSELEGAGSEAAARGDEAVRGQATASASARSCSMSGVATFRAVTIPARPS